LIIKAEWSQYSAHGCAVRCPIALWALRCLPELLDLERLAAQPFRASAVLSNVPRSLVARIRCDLLRRKRLEVACDLAWSRILSLSIPVITTDGGQFSVYLRHSGGVTGLVKLQQIDESLKRSLLGGYS
jgi:hypothetical protein